MKRLYASIPALMALILLATVATAESFSGKVVGVTDGDTISVMRDGKADKVRLHGIDSPESHQAFGSKAKEFVSNAAFGQFVTVEVKDTDRYGRTVGDVILPNGENLNEKIVRNGLAWWYQEYAPNSGNLRIAQNEAKILELGLWSEANPIPPWDFRRGNTGTTPSTSSSNALLQEPAAASDPSGSVYITDTGKKYHKGECRYLSKSKIPSTEEKARSQGYTPCGVCYPAKLKGDGRAPVYESTYIAEPSQTSSPEKTVYVTNTGEKYHAAGCRYLSKSQSPISLSQAKASYSPCSVCNP